MTEHLVGQWLYCSGFEIFAVKHDGLELAADGNWYFLRFDTDGNLARQRGLDGGGTWSLVDTSLMNGPGSYQVNIDTAVGSNPAHPAFQMNPEAMRLQTTGGITDYVAVGP